MTGSICIATGVALIILGTSAVALGNVLLRMWLHDGGKNGGKPK